MNWIKFYFKLCIFKETPENSLYSVGLLITALLLSITLGCWVVMGLNYYAPMLSLLLLSPSVMILFRIILITPALTAAYTTGLLYASGYKNRIVQTLTCVLASICILYFLLFVLFYLTPVIVVSLIDSSPLGSLRLLNSVVINSMIIILWLLAIVKFVYQRAIVRNKAYAAISVLVLIEILMAVYLPKFLYLLVH